MNCTSIALIVVIVSLVVGNTFISTNIWIHTFSATDISCNIVWFLTLHDHFVWNFIFGTKFSSIYLTKSEKRLVFRRLFVNRQRAKDGTHVFDAKYRYVFVV